MEFFLRADKLEKINISDSDMGNDAVRLVMRALKVSPSAKSLVEVHCNYNEVESKKVAAESLEILLHLDNVKLVEFKGHDFSKNLKKEIA